METNAKTITIDGNEYGPEAVMLLREDLRLLRDKSLEQGNFEWAVRLSCIIGVVYALVREAWPDAVLTSYAPPEPSPLPEAMQAALEKVAQLQEQLDLATPKQALKEEQHRRACAEADVVRCKNDLRLAHEHVIFGFYEDRYPSYCYSPSITELHEKATPSELNGLVTRLKAADNVAACAKDLHEYLWRTLTNDADGALQLVGDDVATASASRRLQALHDALAAWKGDAENPVELAGRLFNSLRTSPAFPEDGAVYLSPTAPGVVDKVMITGWVDLVAVARKLLGAA